MRWPWERSAQLGDPFLLSASSPSTSLLLLLLLPPPHSLPLSLSSPHLSYMPPQILPLLSTSLLTSFLQNPSFCVGGQQVADITCNVLLQYFNKFSSSFSLRSSEQFFRNAFLRAHQVVLQHIAMGCEDRASGAGAGAGA
eukprot:760888-Hanusia_phi.AAC.1